MHHAEGAVTGLHVVDQYPHRAQVVQLAERHALALHLLPDAVDVLRAARDLAAMPCPASAADSSRRACSMCRSRSARFSSSSRAMRW
jgi:hypothetical protein